MQAGGSSRTNGSGYPPSVPAVAHPPAPDLKVLGGGKGEVKPPKCPTQGSADIYIYMYIYIYIYRIFLKNTEPLLVVTPWPPMALKLEWRIGSFYEGRGPTIDSKEYSIVSYGRVECSKVDYCKLQTPRS